MRVACIYLPSFPLQVLVRNAPHLGGKPVAVTDRAPRPRVIAVSRAAWESGVRCAMTPAHARSLASDMEVLHADAAAGNEAIAALAEALLASSAAVDIGDPSERAHKALFVEVPHGSRGATFGDRLLAAANRQGLRARVGIADDRFTAWAAAAVTGRLGDPAGADIDGQAPLFTQTCTTVPRGGSAAYLAPLPLSLLPVDDDVRHLLASMKVRTIGDFAALPPPTVGRRWTDTGIDMHKLARGAGSSELAPFTPQNNIAERLELESASADVDPIAFMLHPVIDRACERLRGRGRAASVIAVTLEGPDSKCTRINVQLHAPSSSSRGILDEVRARIISTTLTHSVHSAIVEVLADTEPEVEDLELFSSRTHRRTRRGKRRRRSRQASLPLALDTP
jgi:protein ImuB